MVKGGSKVIPEIRLEPFVVCSGDRSIKRVKQMLSYTMMFADDIVIAGERREQVKENVT